RDGAFADRFADGRHFDFDGHRCSFVFGVRWLDAALDLWFYGSGEAAPIHTSTHPNIQSGVEPPHSKIPLPSRNSGLGFFLDDASVWGRLATTIRSGVRQMGN